MKKIFFVSIFFLSTLTLAAQSVKINGTGAAPGSGVGQGAAYIFAKQG